MSKIEVNAVEPQCGTTLTIGASDTSISGIGTVNWDTTKKTAAFTAVSGRGYFVDTSSAAITVTLPASPSAGAIVSISDYNGSFGTNNCTVGRNSSNINGEASDWVIAINDTSITFVYVDATEGWRVINTSLPSETQNPFLTGSGGTETTCGDFKIHTFTGPGTFTVCSVGATSANNVVDYLVVAGGGAGGEALGAGGAGGYRESCGTCYTSSPLGSCVSALPVTAQGYPITVGAGGAPENAPGNGGSGSNSVFSTITSTGGGGGSESGGSRTGSNGGSGGGGAGTDGGSGTGGSGNTPPVSPSQGNNGGNAPSTPGTSFSSGGGGGATATGATGSAGAGGNGGAGATSSINGTPTARSGGGGGGSYTLGGGGSGGTGGTGGGGNGGRSGAQSTTGTVNTGGGGGGSGVAPNGVGNPVANTGGGSGIVIIRYKFQ